MSYASHQKDLKYDVTYVTVDILSRIEALKMDASFLAYAPPIEGINRAITGDGVDHEDLSTIEQWKDRLASIFKEMLIAKSHYLQLRLIGVADKGKELVSVERNGNRLIRTSEQLLQSKSEETYFKESIEIAPGRVYLSEFSLNREWGKIESPPKMVIRAAVPIYDIDRRVFAVLVINMLAEKALVGFLELHKQGKISNLYDSKMNPLLTSTELSGWIVSENSAVDESVNFLKKAAKEEPVIQGENGDHHIIARKIFYDPSRPGRFLGVITQTSLDSMYAEVLKEFSYEIIVSLFLVGIAMFILFFSIMRQTRPLQNLHVMAKKLSRGEKVSRPDELEIKNDELSELSTALYDMADDIYQKTAMISAQKEALDETALVSETDVEGRIIYANNKFADISGFYQEDLIGNDHKIINSGYHPKQFFANLWSTINSGKIWRGEIKNKRKDGTYYWVDSSIVPIKDKNGSIEKYISIRFDITLKREHEEKLKELTEELENKQYQLDDILENSPGVVYQFVSDRDGNLNFTYVSSQALKIYELTSEDLRNDFTLMLNMIQKNGKNSLKNKILESAKTLNMFQWDGEIVTGKNNKRYVKTSNIPRKNEDGSITWNGILLDITKEKEMAGKLSHQKKLLETASRLASLGEISAGIAHEINNPLAIILLKLDDLKDQILEQESMEPDTIKSFEYIDKGVNRISNITNSLKYLSKQRAIGKDEVCNIQSEVKRSLALVKELYRNKGIKIIDDITTSNTIVKSPSTYIHQILLNLVSNAKDALAQIPEPEIKISILEQDDFVCLSVEDNGPGIPKEIKERIFEPFFTTKGVDNGTGIGLSMCYSMIRGVNGKLICNSSNNGTKFKCMFHIGQKNDTALDVQADTIKGDKNLVPGDKIKILLIDDEEKFLILLEEELSKIGHEVRSSNSAVTALEIIKKDRFDVIISDLKMPQMTGLQLFEEIKVNGLARGSFKILMSGHINIDKEQYGIDSTITKPFRLKSLIPLLAGLYS